MACRVAIGALVRVQGLWTGVRVDEGFQAPDGLLSRIVQRCAMAQTEHATLRGTGKAMAGISEAMSRISGGPGACKRSHRLSSVAWNSKFDGVRRHPGGLYRFQVLPHVWLFDPASIYVSIARRVTGVRQGLLLESATSPMGFFVSQNCVDPTDPVLRVAYLGLQ